MKERMERMEGDHMDAINVKDTEIAALRKSMQQQKQMLLDQKQKLQLSIDRCRTKQDCFIGRKSRLS